MYIIYIGKYLCVCVYICIYKHICIYKIHTTHKYIHTDICTNIYLCIYLSVCPTPSTNLVLPVSRISYI